MNVYSNKQRERVLLVAAAVIVVATLWYSNDIAQRIRVEEQTKVNCGRKPLSARGVGVYTQQLFEELGAEERHKADRLADAYRLINNPPRGMDLTFITDYSGPSDILRFLTRATSCSGERGPRRRPDSLKATMRAANAPIVFNDVGHTIYCRAALSELKDVMQDLIDSFISETVLNRPRFPS